MIADVPAAALAAPVAAKAPRPTASGWVLTVARPAPPASACTYSASDQLLLFLTATMMPGSNTAAVGILIGFDDASDDAGELFGCAMLHFLLVAPVVWSPVLQPEDLRSWDPARVGRRRGGRVLDGTSYRVDS